MARELQETQTRCTNDRLELEKKLRSLQDENVSLREEVEEAQSELAAQERQHKHRLTDLEGRHAALQQSVHDLHADLATKSAALQHAQQQLARRATETTELENEVLRLRTQTGDADTLEIIKRELSEQVAHMRKLEATNRDQLAELKQFRKQQRSIDVVEEDKRVLHNKLRVMEELRRQLGEAQLRVQVLEDERRSWTAYLEGEAAEGGELRFDSPEEMARAFIRERLERASLVEKLGAVQPELSVKDDNIRALEEEKSRLAAELGKLRSAGGDGKLKHRLERQRSLAVKEVEYLRAQLRTFDAEESEFQPEQFDAQKSKRIQDLEELVDEYRRELQTLHADLSSAEQHQQSQQSPPVTTGSKRQHESDEDDAERAGELRRKNRTLQEELSAAQTKVSVLEADLRAHSSQLAALKAPSRTRILELRSNPTATAAAIKISTLETLRAENAALLAQLEGRNPPPPSVPTAVLEATRAENAQLKATVADREKKMLRLKQIWGAKALEFREAVASILGWKLDFMPNGRVRVSSMFYPGTDDDEDGSGSSNSIVFDGENGTMKVSGGPQSVFAGEIRDLIAFWVEGRKEIPCFLAAMTLEFYERTTRAARA